MGTCLNKVFILSFIQKPRGDVPCDKVFPINLLNKTRNKVFNLFNNLSFIHKPRGDVPCDKHVKNGLLIFIAGASLPNNSRTLKNDMIQGVNVGCRLTLLALPKSSL